jgi:hypothetical protein
MPTSEFIEPVLSIGGGYVSQAEWLRPPGRLDVIDEVADSCERRPDPTRPAPTERIDGWAA